MKKLIFSAILFCGIVFAGYSQNGGFGIKVGLSSTEVDFKNKQFTPQGSQTGYHVGVFGRIGGAGFFVQPELLFTQTSGKFLNNGDEFKAEFNRLDIPVMVGMRFLKVLRLQAGPIASLNINSKLKEAGSTVSDAEFKNATLGYQAGVGLDLGNLSIDGRYEGGLSKWTENIGSFNTDNRINQWVLSVGFKIF
ncbi:porin family protein [Algoriphagus boritolerans]|uniref:Outer membrane protein beta-barrel domain-containing protein n=1 Tax=Algoriphagus boritolerans DSM 17298 = JCM 18970 TaxID=1120964 RepID=A0A1H5UUY4_9BACT|nr:porin family protein [Algoriphagus boritolerans]SEF78281.1 Outer membrane protein beta-barrel domain-containing protein [Algoriphagus boritolerans DSM 17298 = JCM 18970]